MKNSKTIIVEGQAILPGKCMEGRVFRIFQVMLELRKRDEMILDFECTALDNSIIARKLKKTIVGNKLEKGIEKASVMVNEEIFSITKKTIVAALENALYNYKYMVKGEINVHWDRSVEAVGGFKEPKNKLTL